MSHALFDALAPLVPDAVETRRQIHRNPELAYQEHDTSQLVADSLERWGWEVHRGIAGTGVVGRLKAGHGQRSIGLRADMDALPIEEATGLAWASRRIGRMHACGHDGHTATLLAAARHLAATQRFSGTVNLIFQPAEEGGAGAKRMIDEGLFDRFPCDAVFGLHNRPGMPVGKLGFRAGPAMSSADSVVIVLDGSGGHGAYPHRSADPVLAGSSLVMALHTIVSRNVNPLDTAVITVGAFLAGDASNVIPDRAELRLTVRSLDRDVRALLKDRIFELVRAQAQSFGVHSTVDWREGYPVLVNDAVETAFAAQVARELLGDDQVLIDPPPATGSEDFAYMLEVRPGCYFHLGNGELSSRRTLHSSGYDFNDAALPVGAAYWCLLAERFLARPT